MKGQIVSTDFMVAILIFISVFLIMLTSWYYNLDYFQSTNEFSYMEQTASRVLDNLVRTGGYPANWNIVGASTIGLADSDRRIDQIKLNAFLGLGYATVKQKLFAGYYDFRFYMPYSGLSFGANPGTNNTVYVRRFAVYNNSAQPVELYIWRQK